MPVIIIMSCMKEAGVKGRENLTHSHISAHQLGPRQKEDDLLCMDGFLPHVLARKSFCLFIGYI